jgi:translation initiation factor 3 subunit L
MLKQLFFHCVHSVISYLIRTHCISNLTPIFGSFFLQVWNVVGVLNYLQALIEKSMILQILDEEKDGNLTFTATDGYDYHGGTNVLKVLGYFSIVGLLRVHCLLGDYQSGLHALLPIDINQPGVFNTVIGCQITTIYYYGFANLMLRR